MKLWLDDVRPAPEGWTHVKTFQEARDLVLYSARHFASLTQADVITEMSLDHDLGACDGCLAEMAPKTKTPEEWLEVTDYRSMPFCEHFGTGYTFVCWLEENPDYWPETKPRVHSHNPVGRQRMQVVIDRAYDSNGSDGVTG